jgi:hypothetical protein
MDWQDECCDPYRGAYAAGQELGYQSRRHHDYHDGYITGRNTAIEYGMELGFITGVAERWTTVMPQLPDRVQRTWHDLKELLETFPTAHEILNTIAADTPTQVPLEAKTNVDAQVLMQRIRAKYKLLTVQLGLADKMSLSNILNQTSKTPATAGKSASGTGTDW